MRIHTVCLCTHDFKTISEFIELCVSRADLGHAEAGARASHTAQPAAHEFREQHLHACRGRREPARARAYRCVCMIGAQCTARPRCPWRHLRYKRACVFARKRKAYIERAHTNMRVFPIKYLCNNNTNTQYRAYRRRRLVRAQRVHWHWFWAGWLAHSISHHTHSHDNDIVGAYRSMAYRRMCV